MNKKVLGLLLVLALAFTLVGCEGFGVDEDLEFGRLEVERPVNQDGDYLSEYYTTIELDGDEKDSEGFSEGLEPGDYTVTIESYGHLYDGEDVYEQEVTIEKNETVTVEAEFEAQDQYDITISVLDVSTDAEGEPVNEPLAGAEVTIDGDEVGDKYDTETNMLGEVVIEDVYVGDRNIVITKEDYADVRETITVDADNLEFTFETDDVISNVYKFTFDPADYDVEVEEGVHVVGDMQGWDPTDQSLALREQEDEWVGFFPASENDAFKFMYDSTDWNDGNDIGDGEDNFDMNSDVVENAVARKVTFDPADYDVEVAEGVHVVGDMQGWDPTDQSISLREKGDVWEGYLLGLENDAFKLMYDSTDWDDGNDIGDGEDNFDMNADILEEVLAYKVTFDPAEYDVEVAEGVHVVGDMQGWDPTDQYFALEEDDEGVWSTIIYATENDAFKFMYDSTDWDDGNDIGDGEDNFDMNADVVEML